MDTQKDVSKNLKEFSVVMNLGTKLKLLQQSAESCLFHLKLIDIMLIKCVRSSFTYHCRFQQLLLLLLIIEITFFSNTNRINQSCLRPISGRIVIIAKRFLNLLNLIILIKQRRPFSLRNLVFRTFGKLEIVFATTVNMLYLITSYTSRSAVHHLFSDPEVSSHIIRGSYLLKPLPRMLVLMTWMTLYLRSS